MKVLFLAAHPDDLELSCGGILHKYRFDWDITCVIFCSKTLNGECLKDISCKSLEHLGVKNIIHYDFKPSFFYEERNEIWQNLDKLKLGDFDVIFTHDADLHQDHVVIFQETSRVFLNNTIILYNIPRSSVGLFEGNWYESLSKLNLNAKLKSLKFYNYYYSNKDYMKSKYIKSQCIYNGLFVNCEYAEVFKLKKGLNVFNFR